MKNLLMFVLLLACNFVIAQQERSYYTSNELQFNEDFKPNVNLPYYGKECSIIFNKLNSIPEGKKLDERKVLFEQGTNSGCGPCATYNPGITSFFHSMGDKIVAIRFHAYWPSNADPMYKYNTTQNKYFLSYMGVNAVPWMDADGIVSDIWPFTSANLTSIYNTRMAVATNVFVDVEDKRIPGDSIKSTISVLVTGKLPDANIRLRVAAIEEKITYSTPPGSNGEKVFEQVFRKAYPESQGIEFKYAPGMYQFVYTYQIDPVWRDTMMYTVAWIQNDNTKEVLNAGRGHYVAAPETVMLFSPLNNAGSIAKSPELKWQKSNNADYYSLQVSSDELFNNLVYNKDSIYTTSITLPELEEGTKYFWRVKAYKGTTSTEFSSTWQFITALNKPTDIEGLSMCGTLELRWNDNSNKETGYKIERGKYYVDSLTFSPLAMVLADTSIYWYSVEDSTTYAYRVYAFTDNTNSEYSDTAIVSVTVGVENEITNNYNFNLNQNYPNPFNPATKISYSIPSAGFVTLKIYNMLGQTVALLVNKELSAGKYEVEFNAASLASGTYFYELKTGNKVSCKKMILLR